jgi:streptomycin 6-kinase
MYSGDAGRAWIAALPRLAADMQERWELRLDGQPMSGAVALVLPVLLPDETPAVLKLQPVDDETAGEPIALRAWEGHGAVRLLRHDQDSGSMLLDRLDADRSLGSLDDLVALQTLSELLARLTAVEAPAGIRHLSDVAAAMLERVPPYADGLVETCAAAVREVLPESGDRLLHWDLHYDNVLAPATAGGEPWLAIDPKPLAGDPGFDLLPALHNRWDDVVATGNVPAAVNRRFDLMTEVVGLDRQRAIAWTLGRVLQNLLWEAESGTEMWLTGPDRAIAAALLGR